jgi:hypothetical protein
MSTELVSRLDDWARKRQIFPKEFDCPHYEECKGSLPGSATLDRGNTCSMSAVGEDYGKPIGGKPFKLVFVGIDRGYRGGGKGFTDMQNGEGPYGGQSPLGQNYKGVVRTAAAILGSVGQHCLDNCYKGRCVGDRRPNGELCILRFFAQPNLVKCAPAEGGMKTRTSSVMKIKCAEHLVSELSILKPNVLVFHAADARWCFGPAVENHNWRLSPIEVPVPKYRGGFSPLHLLKADDFKCYVLFLNFPGHGWLERQRAPIVEPSLTFLRSEGVIPRQ